MAGVVHRRSARVLVVDDARRVLLLHGLDPANPAVRYWLTPGGGLEPGESAAEAAVRELHEETGLQVTATAVGAPVWHDVSVFPFEGLIYEQSQDFFLVRTAGFEVTPAAMEDHELRSVTGFAWWSLESLSSTTETVYPAGLVSLVVSVIGDQANTSGAAQEMG